MEANVGTWRSKGITERKEELGKRKQTKARTKQPAQTPLDHAVKMERIVEKKTRRIWQAYSAYNLLPDYFWNINTTAIIWGKSVS